MRMNRDVSRENPSRSLSFLNRSTATIAWLASIASIFCLVAAGASALAQAQELRPQLMNRHKEQRTEQLMQWADTVVYGKVVDKKSDWNDRRTFIYTTITIAVDRTVKGKATSTLSFNQLGGQVGKLQTTSSHLPQFSVGEEVLVFLNLARTNKLAPPLNGVGGKFLIHRDEKTQAPFLTGDSVNMPIFSARTRHSIAPEQIEASGRIALDDLLYSLQRARSAGSSNRQRGGE